MASWVSLERYSRPRPLQSKKSLPSDKREPGTVPRLIAFHLPIIICVLSYYHVLLHWCSEPATPASQGKASPPAAAETETDSAARKVSVEIIDCP